MNGEPFQYTARYYDALYDEKNSREEADFIARTIRTLNPEAKTLLDIGCGTGRHSQLLQELGFEVTGVDRSAEMIAVARSKADSTISHPQYHIGDFQKIRLDNTFDIVISLFHVMSYQTTDAGLLAALKTARAHLSQGGYFIFDAWYGPGVLNEKPEPRVKEVFDTNTETHIVRRATPEMLPDKHQVRVTYNVEVKSPSHYRHFNETHVMRYLFSDEISRLSGESGFDICSAKEWLTNNELTTPTWNAYWVLRAR